MRRTLPLLMMLSLVLAGCTVHIFENVRYPAVVLPAVEPELTPLPTTQPVKKPTPATDHFGAFMRRVP